MKGINELIARGLESEAVPAASEARFPDGAHYRIEIPSVEGPTVLKAVVEAAHASGVTVNRVSQGSGAMLLGKSEMSEMARIASDHGIEVSLFTGPREEWDVGVYSRSKDGPSLSGRLRGFRQLRYAIDDVMRGIECGIRGFLIADTGLLEVLVEMQSRGDIPASVVWKVSAVTAPSNPITFLQLERLGASTINVPADMTYGQLGELRVVSSLPIDLYVESPDAMGGVVRGQETADLARISSPLYAKFGLRNSKSLYPSGLHIVNDAVEIAKEKVHRAQVAKEWIEESNEALVQSSPAAKGLGVPELR